MFPTEQYQVATLMRKDFSKEVAHKLVQAFKKTDGQTRLQMVFKPVFPETLQFIPSE